MAGAIVVSEGFRTALVPPHAEVLEDRSGALGLEEVRAPGAAWSPWAAEEFVFGFSRSVYWVRWSIESRSVDSQPIIIDVGSPRQDHLTLWVLASDGRIERRLDTGDRLSFDKRASPARDFLLPMSLAAGERVQVYLQLRSHDGLFEPLPLRVSQRWAYVQRMELETLILTLFHGGLIMLAAYNLVLFLATRERSHGFYVLYLVSFLLWSNTHNGFGFKYLWPDSPSLNNQMGIVSSALTFGSAGAFALSYLRFNESVPSWWWRFNQLLVLANVMVAVLGLMGLYAKAVAIGMVLGGFLGLTTFGTAVCLLFKGSRPARFYVPAYLLLLAGILGYGFQLLRVLPSTAVTAWGMVVGASLEMLLLALGLADSVNRLKADKLDAERRAREAQEAMTVRLEQQVSERTQALEQANRRLNALAITDELTGAFNRRHFNEVCKGLLGDFHRGEPLAMCMFDVDHFKLYNDELGHQAGDETLRAITLAVQQTLRRSGDVLFRLGGEEFGVVFTAPTPEAAHEFVEQLRLAVLSLARPHPGHAPGVVTASFGVGWWPATSLPTLTPDAMYALADELLYEAKSAGRNCVAVGVGVSRPAAPGPWSDGP